MQTCSLIGWPSSDSWVLSSCMKMEPVTINHEKRCGNIITNKTAQLSQPGFVTLHEDGRDSLLVLYEKAWEHGGGVVVAFSWLARIWENVQPFVHSLRFFCFCFHIYLIKKKIEVKISSCTLISFFRPGSVHSGSAIVAHQ